jgi:hypothetical protein
MLCCLPCHFCSIGCSQFSTAEFWTCWLLGNISKLYKPEKYRWPSVKTKNIIYSKYLQIVFAVLPIKNRFYLINYNILLTARPSDNYDSNLETAWNLGGLKCFLFNYRSNGTKIVLICVHECSS